LRYEINVTGCGSCPNHTVSNNATCREVPINSTGENFCMFTVKAVVCERSESSLNRVTVILKGIVFILNHRHYMVHLSVLYVAPLVTVTEVLPTYKVSQSQELIQFKTTFIDSVV
jgi:hypothetical protein